MFFFIVFFYFFCFFFLFFFFSSRRRHTRSLCDWSSDVCSSDLTGRGRQKSSSSWSRDTPGDSPVTEAQVDRLVDFHPHAPYPKPMRPGSLATLPSARDGAASFARPTRSEERRVGKECRARGATA